MYRIMMYYIVFNEKATTGNYTYLHTHSLHDALPILRVADGVLHVDLDLDDVFVGGQDRHVVAEGLDLGGGDFGHALDRPRQLEVRAGLEDPREQIGRAHV